MLYLETAAEIQHVQVFSAVIKNFYKVAIYAQLALLNVFVVNNKVAHPFVRLNSFFNYLDREEQEINQGCASEGI